MQGQRDFTARKKLGSLKKVCKKDIPSTAQQCSQSVYLTVFGHSDLVIILPYLVEVKIIVYIGFVKYIFHESSLFSSPHLDL